MFKQFLVRILILKIIKNPIKLEINAITISKKVNHRYFCGLPSKYIIFSSILFKEKIEKEINKNKIK